MVINSIHISCTKLAYLFHHGRVPSSITHKDGNLSNFAPDNLIPYKPVGRGGKGSKSKHYSSLNDEFSLNDADYTEEQLNKYCEATGTTLRERLAYWRKGREERAMPVPEQDVRHYAPTPEHEDIDWDAVIDQYL